MTGKLIGVGVGPGDPSLITVAAVDVLGRTPVVAYLAAEGRECLARIVAHRYFADGVIERSYVAPMHGTDQDLLSFYEHTAGAIASELQAGRDVAFLCLGDPLFFGSFSYLLSHLEDRFKIETVPGITSFNAGLARLCLPLVLQDDRFLIMPAAGFVPSLLDNPESNSIVLLKLGQRMPRIREILRERGLLQKSWIASRIGWPDERICRLQDWGQAAAPYMSLLIIQNTVRRRR